MAYASLTSPTLILLPFHQDCPHLKIIHALQGPFMVLLYKFRCLPHHHSQFQQQQQQHCKVGKVFLRNLVRSLIYY